MEATLENPPAQSTGGRFDPAHEFEVLNLAALRTLNPALARLGESAQGPLRRSEIEAVLSSNTSHPTRQQAVESARWGLRELVRSHALKPLSEQCPERAPMLVDEIIKDAMARADAGGEAEALVELLIGEDARGAEEVKYARLPIEAVRDAIRDAAASLPGFCGALLKRLPIAGRLGGEMVEFAERFIPQLPKGEATRNEGERLYRAGLTHQDVQLRTLAVQVLKASDVRDKRMILLLSRIQGEDIPAREGAWEYLAEIIAATIPQPRS